MDLLKDRRAVLALGAVLALTAGLALALALILHGEDQGAPPASEGGLVVETGYPANLPLTALQTLPCFVNGRLAGQLTLADCARRNGVATGPLTVGVSPPPPIAPSTAQASSPVMLSPPMLPAAAPDASQAAAAPSGDLRPCASYQDGAWATGPAPQSLTACVQTLFQGQCLSPGAAAYGRWGSAILELAEGKVGIALDGHTFRTLAMQQGGCALPSP